MRVAPPVELDESQRETLLRYARGRRVSVRLAMRAKLILAAASGASNKDIAQEYQTDEHTVARWRRRFLEQGIEGIMRDAPRPGRRPKLDEQTERQIVDLTRNAHLYREAGWSSRALAERLGVSSSMILRVWRAHGLTGKQVSRQSR